MDPIYLDYAAATPMDEYVAEVMQPYFTQQFYNPSALYEGARAAKRSLEDARGEVAKVIGSRPSEVVFTSGGTESTNLAIRGIGEKYPDSDMVISAVEHDAVRAPAKLFSHKECRVDNKGMLDIDDLAIKIGDKTALVSVMYANNEVGSIQPIKEVVELANRIRRARKIDGNKTPLYVHVDACQAPLYLDINVARLGVDMMTLNGGKIYGPKQSGILYVRAGVVLSPQILGGGQESGLRSGTENLASSVGFAAALVLAQETRPENVDYAHALSGFFMNSLEDRFGATVNGHRRKRLPNNIHVTFTGADNERMLFSLDQQDVWAASGSACSASKDEVSHVLSAMGVSEQDARSSLRFTVGRDTTIEQLERVLDCIDVALAA